MKYIHTQGHSNLILCEIFPAHNALIFLIDISAEVTANQETEVAYHLHCDNFKTSILLSSAATKAMHFRPSPQVPALQYIGNVEPGGAAAEAGLCTGDFLIEVSL